MRLGWLLLEGRPSVRAYKGRPVTLLRRLFDHDRDRLNKSQGICVLAGPGSFSAIRIGVLYVNLLARLTRKPLVAVSVEESLDLGELLGHLKRKAPHPVEYVAPIYDREPNITVPRV